MKIVADSHIPFLDACISSMIQLVSCDHITHNDILDADALLVRTRTVCDAAILNGTQVRFIGSATIGTDHIDLNYCREAGIEVCNAPGCNAPAVAQWVLSSIGHWMDKCNINDTSSLTLGVVGVGHVGSIVARWARQLGFAVMLNDPPLEHSGNCNVNFSHIDQLLEHCDIITFHTPLTRESQWPTWHLCDVDFLNRASRCRLLLNAARGAVCDTNALLEWNGDTAIDCWESEPNIDGQLLNRAFIATPHIAGYSQEGKMRGTAMVLQGLSRHFGISIQPLFPKTPLNGAGQVTLQQIMDSYNPLTDTAHLKSSPESFEVLRNNYPLRHEVY